jgi:transcriptional regulator with XRE-family HTH domain
MGLTQAELARAAGVSERSVSDLERGIYRTARKDTARLLADALGLAGAEREAFEAAARGRAVADLVMSAAQTGDMAGIYAIGGMAGIGKTAFAVHAARLLAPQFPDGQIFVQLHGHTPGLPPTDPADALASLLQAIGIPPGQVPPGLETRMGLWRDRVAGKRLVLVLDDAAGSEQVRPLLPSAAGSLVLVTSRRHLTALEGNLAISLDILPPGEASGADSAAVRTKSLG